MAVFRFLFPSLVALLILVCAGGRLAWASDGLLDFSIVHPPAVQERTIKEPVLTWMVQPEVSSVELYCSKLTGFDGAGFWREGCVAWSVEQARCTMVTSQRTSHTLMGRLLVMCMLAGAEPS
jgi:hypothetical protein